ncbi:hypothetical protein KY284_000601 [Solanum tuberosum]|nr:hypothetical protein KY284_000601 [Solanum tuberosum]
MEEICESGSDNLNIVIISHGLTIRIILMRLFKWTAEEVESLISPKNGEIRILELGHEGKYSLALHHDDKTLEKWGLSPQMILDQKQKA